MFVGDVHGDTDFLTRAVDLALEVEADRIIQLGDLGFGWPGHKGHQFMADLAFFAKRMPIWWVPGNHESYSALEDMGGSIAGDEPEELFEGFFNLPRGCRFPLGASTALAIGGAASIDKHWRVEGESWWPQESIDPEDVERCIAGGPVDIVVSHDCPSWVQIPGNHSANKTTHRPSWFNRSCLQRVLEDCRPKRWYHGHHHVRYVEFGDIARVTGLASNFDPEDALLLEEFL